MRRFVMLSVAALAVVFALSYAVPAIGGPQALSSASPTSLAKRALKTAKKADKRAKKAQSTANQALTGARQGLSANVQTLSSAPIPIPPGTVSQGSIGCPSGTVAISGGYALTGSEASAIFDRKSGNGWSIGVDNVVAISETALLTVDVQCAPTNTAGTASRSAGADRARDQRVLQSQRALYKR